MREGPKRLRVVCDTNVLLSMLGLPEEAAQGILRVLKRHAEIVSPKKRVSVIHEKESDNRILECALEARAEVLITGHFKHIRPLGTFRGTKILTPREFLDRYFPSR